MQKNVVEAAGVIAVATVTANTVMQVRMTSEYICRARPAAVYVTTSAVGFFLCLSLSLSFPFSLCTFAVSLRLSDRDRTEEEEARGGISQ